MRAKYQWRMALCAILFAFSLAGCSSASKKEETEAPVSTLPWNTPEKWEKSAPIGGATY
ncbi:MAG: hypothetical protein HY360_20330 [Verrucomicrobia bacterium]|nr:hypothetical protein [Verrucomicrobiota bacterium]